MFYVALASSERVFWPGVEYQPPYDKKPEELGSEFDHFDMDNSYPCKFAVQRP